MARIEGIVSVETGHHILLVANSPHLWLADLDTHTGYHTLDEGPDIGADVPVFPVAIEELQELQFGEERAYFLHRKAKVIGNTVMNGRVCERQDVAAESYLLIGCFEPMTGHVVALGLKLGDQVIGVNYMSYDTSAIPPANAFVAPASIKFVDRAHQDKTHAAQ
jgi:hypothetical protein